MLKLPFRTPSLNLAIELCTFILHKSIWLCTACWVIGGWAYLNCKLCKMPLIRCFDLNLCLWNFVYEFIKWVLKSTSYDELVLILLSAQFFRNLTNHINSCRTWKLEFEILNLIFFRRWTPGPGKPGHILTTDKRTLHSGFAWILQKVIEAKKKTG